MILRGEIPNKTVYEDDYATNPDLIALRSGRPVLIVPEGGGLTTRDIPPLV